MNKLNKYLGKEINEILKDEYLKVYFSESNVIQIGPHYDLTNSDYYLTNEQMGIGAVFNPNKKLRCFHLYDGLDGNCKTFPHELPQGLLFSDNIEKAHKKIGIPKFESGGGEVLPIVGLSRIWRKYQFDNYYLHISFHNKGESISLINLLSC